MGPWPACQAPNKRMATHLMVGRWIGCGDLVGAQSRAIFDAEVPARSPVAPNHFIPGLGVDGSTAGASAYLGLTCYFCPSAACTAATCQLDVGFSSTTGGAAWSTPTQLAGPMTLSWLASTNQGPMVGDYIATSILADEAGDPSRWRAPSGGLFDEAMFVPTGGLPVTGSSIAAGPVVSTSSDHATITVHLTAW